MHPRQIDTDLTYIKEHVRYAQPRNDSQTLEDTKKVFVQVRRE